MQRCHYCKEAPQDVNRIAQLAVMLTFDNHFAYSSGLNLQIIVNEVQP